MAVHMATGMAVPAREHDSDHQAPLQAPLQAPVETPSGCHAETVTEVEHYTDRLFRFRISRPASFRFRSGEFVMIGLPGTRPVFRAYSIASPSWDDTLEFYSIKVPAGPLTEYLQRVQPGDTIWMRRKATGTLVLDALLPGRNLWMFGTGTGIAPFASVIRDPESYEKFETLVLAHGCRLTAELAYGQQVVTATCNDPLVGDLATNRLKLIDATTRQPHARNGRLTTLLETGSLESIAGAPLDPATDRVMICGSMAMLRDMRDALESRGFTEGSNARPGTLVIEKAFVD